MAISKVIYKSSSSAQGVTWIDATPSTAAAADILSPKTAMLANGVVTQGTGSGGSTPTGNINITQAGVTDVTNYATVTVPYADANGSVEGNFVTVSNVLKYRISGGAYAESGGWVDGDSSVGTDAIQDLVAIPRNTTITPTTSAQIIGDRETVLEGPVTIAAMPSGTAGTPVATKGTVTNHSVTITPSVTNNTGYITGSTKTGTAVTVTAAELVSGSQTVTQNSTVDCTNLAQIVVNVSGEATLITKNITNNGTYNASSDNADGYSSVTVNVSASPKQVNFIDYDGTILYAYTAQEANALSALPANPSHSGLTAQGWNWTLAQIKARLTAIPDGDVWVGQMYITQSRDTEIDCTFDNVDNLSPYLAIAINGSVTVDWGDNTSPSTGTGTSLTTLVYIAHTYADVGKYTITISVNSGSFTFYNTSNSYPSVLVVTDIENSNRRYSQAYSSCIDAIRLGASVNIGNYMFSHCPALQSVTIPDSVTSIGNYAFQYCYALQSITIPDSLTSISTYAFLSCTTLQRVAIPDDMTSIGTYAFYNCYSLRSITVPDSVTSIESYAFSNCYSLQHVTIPDDVTSIESYAFSNCYSLQNITIPDSVTSINIRAFQNCQSLQSITIPDGVTSITNYAFSNCYSLQNITIPDSVTSIGNYAFQTCQSLQSITIPDDVTSIGSYAFAACHSLQSITIPAGVTSIGTSAFQNCYNMEEYHIKPTSVPTGGTNMFSGIVSGTVIYVPSAKLNDYKTASNWSTYASYMQGE